MSVRRLLRADARVFSSDRLCWLFSCTAIFFFRHLCHDRPSKQRSLCPDRGLGIRETQTAISAALYQSLCLHRCLVRGTTVLNACCVLFRDGNFCCCCVYVFVPAVVGGLCALALAQKQAAGYSGTRGSKGSHGPVADNAAAEARAQVWQ